MVFSESLWGITLSCPNHTEPHETSKQDAVSEIADSVKTKAVGHTRTEITVLILFLYDFMDD